MKIKIPNLRKLWKEFFLEFSYNFEILVFDFFRGYGTGRSMTRKLFESNVESCYENVLFN